MLGQLSMTRVLHKLAVRIFRHVFEASKHTTLEQLENCIPYVQMLQFSGILSLTLQKAWIACSFIPL